MRDRSMTLTDGVVTLSASSALGDDSTLVDVEGWYEPEIRLGMVERYGNGSIAEPQSWEARQLLVRGHASGLSRAGVSQWLRALSAVCSPDRPSVLTVTDQGLALSAEVLRAEKPRQAHSLDDGWIEWELPLVAPDPFLYGVAEERHVPLVGAGVGLKFDLFSVGGVLTFGSAVAADVALHNPGNAVAYPRYVVTGDLPSGFRLSQSSGGFVDFAGPVWADAPAVVDMAGRVLVAGVDRSDEIARVEWAGVAPGGSLVPELSAGQGSGFAVATIRPTWL